MLRCISLEGNGGRENGKDSTRECARKQVALWSEAGRHSKDLSVSIAKVGLIFSASNSMHNSTDLPQRQ